MLVLTRKKNTSLRIGDDILVTVRGFRPGEVVLEIECPAATALRGPDGDVPLAPADPSDAGAQAGGPQTRCDASGDAGDDPTIAPVRRCEVCLKEDQAVQIGQDVKVIAARMVMKEGLPYRVRLGVEAPRAIPVVRTDRQARPPQGSQTA